MHCYCYSVHAHTLHTVTVLCTHVECTVLLTDSLHTALLQSPNCSDQPPLHCHTACMLAQTLHLRASAACMQTHCTHRHKLAGGRAFWSFLQRKKENNALYFFFSRGSRRDVHLRCSCACVMPLPVPCFAMIAFAACYSSMYTQYVYIQWYSRE
jgi:hypothetical protein